MIENVSEFLKCISDESRLSILNILANGDNYVELIAAKLGLTPATVCYHLKKLEGVGAVTCHRSQFYVIYSLNRELFEHTVSELVFTKDTGTDGEAEYRQKVIDSFFSDGRLERLPAQQKKRRIVLEKIAEAFECDRDYSEREVNIILLDFSDDFCTLRRSLVEFELLEREGSVYRKKA